MAIDLNQGCIAFAVLARGGVLGVGAKDHAIPWQALSLAAGEKKFVLNIPKDRIENAPYFDKSRWQESVNETWLDQMYNYYGYKPYWMQ